MGRGLLTTQVAKRCEASLKLNTGSQMCLEVITYLRYILQVENVLVYVLAVNDVFTNLYLPSL